MSFLNQAWCALIQEPTEGPYEIVVCHTATSFISDVYYTYRDVNARVNNGETFMVNFTVTIPEELKAEMDKYPEVNWSEVLRKSIQIYLQARQNPVPQLELEMKEAHVNFNPFLAKPYVFVSLKATNKLATDLVIDRILYDIVFLRSVHEEEARGGFEGQFLQYRKLQPDKPSDIQLTLYTDVDLLRRLTEKMESTFGLRADLTVFVQGFTNPFITRVLTKVPIDEWRDEVKSALNWNEQHWNPKPPESDKPSTHGTR